MTDQIHKALTAKEEAEAAKPYLPKYILLHRGLMHAAHGGQNRYYPATDMTIHLEYEDDVAERDQADAAFAIWEYRQAQIEATRQAQAATMLEAEQFAREEWLRHQTETATASRLLAALYRQSPDMATTFLANRDSIQGLRAQAVTAIAEMMAKIADYDKAIADLNALIPAPVDKPKRRRKTA